MEGAVYKAIFKSWMKTNCNTIYLYYYRYPNFKEIFEENKWKVDYSWKIRNVLIKYSGLRTELKIHSIKYISKKYFYTATNDLIANEIIIPCNLIEVIKKTIVPAFFSYKKKKEQYKKKNIRLPKRKKRVAGKRLKGTKREIYEYVSDYYKNINKRNQRPKDKSMA